MFDDPEPLDGQASGQRDDDATSAHVLPDAATASSGDDGATIQAVDDATVKPRDRAEVVPTTGDARVDDALGRLGELEAVDVSVHAAIYDEIHRSLSAVLDGGPAVTHTDE